MSDDRQWLNLGLGALPQELAERVRLFRLLVFSGGLLRQRLDRELAETGLTTQQGSLLQWIETQGEPPTISAAAAGLSMTHQNVKQIASALDRKGFLEIVVDPSDRRARRLVLTAKHRRFWKRRNPHDYTKVAGWTSTWSDDEVSAVVDLLSRLCRDLMSTVDGPQP